MNCCGYRLLGGFIIFCVAGCATEKKVTEKKLRLDAWGHEESFSVGKDEDGNPKMKSNKRSSFENKKSSIVRNRDFRGEDYTAKSYRKKRWGGNTVFNKKVYRGNTDASRYQKEPWFARKRSVEGTKYARANGQSYSTSMYRTQRAYESKGKYLPTKSDAQVDSKRRSYRPPSVINWKEQGGLSVQDTNSMLGRGH